MKITGYQQSITNVGGSSSGAPTLNVSAQAKAVASDGINFNPLAKGLNDWAKTIDSIHEQEDRHNVLAAMDRYNEQVNSLLHGENGYLNRQMADAEGIAVDFADKEQKIREQTLGATKLHFQGNRSGLQHSLQANAQQSFDNVVKWQKKQMDAVDDLHTENIISNNITTAQEAYNDNNVVGQAKQNILNALSLRHSSKGVDFMDSVTRKTLGNFGSSLVDAAMAHNDISGASNLYQEYKSFMSPDQRNRFEQKAVNLQVGDQQRSFIDGLIGENLSVEEAMARIDNMDGFTVKNINSQGIPEQAEGTTWERMSPKTSLEGLFPKTRKGLDAAALIYSKLFPGEKLLLTSGTDGKHETHRGESIDVNDNWGKTILADKKNRDKFKAALSAQGIRVLDEYENDTKYKTGAHLHLEFNDFKPEGGETKVPLSLKEKQDLKNMYLASVNQQKQIRRMHETDFYDSIAGQAAELAKQGVPLTQAMQQLAYTQTGKNFMLSKNAVSAAYSGLKLGGTGSGNGTSEYGKGSHPVVVSGIKEMIAAGKFDNKADAVEYAKSKGLSEADVNKVWVAWDQNLKGEGEFKYQWSNIKQRVMQGQKASDAVGEQMWAEARAYGADWLKQYMKDNNGAMPSEAELIDACIKGKTKNMSMNYKKPGALFSSTFEYSPGAQSAAKIDSIGDFAPDKNKVIVYYKQPNGKLKGVVEDKNDVVSKLGGKK